MTSCINGHANESGPCQDAGPYCEECVCSKCHAWISGSCTTCNSKHGPCYGCSECGCYEFCSNCSYYCKEGNHFLCNDGHAKRFCYWSSTCSNQVCLEHDTLDGGKTHVCTEHLPLAIEELKRQAERGLKRLKKIQ